MAAETTIHEDLDSIIEQRNMLLKTVDAATIQKAWFTLSHLILDDGAKVIDMGCDDGMMTYAMAVLSPKLKFIGVDKSKRQINKAREKYQLHNLEFQIGDAVSELFEPETIDAVINSYVLHEVYSGSRYNERIVADTLKRQFRFLKKGGTMFIRDYVRPPPEEYVLMEMPDTPSKGDDLAKLSEPDLLVWYSEHARPQHDAGTGGFFLEELPARFPKTRLFRLPYKWAYEFAMRKDDRTHWETALPVEYTFYTMRDFRRELRALGARTHYAAPHWDDDLIEKKLEGRFRLYDDTGQALGMPPTGYIIVALKMAERKSLHIHERRPSVQDESSLKISTLRDQNTGRLVDVVSPTMELGEVIPYRLDEHGQLKLYLFDGIARSIANAVPRSGVSLDDRRWSGHMIEPIAIEHALLQEMNKTESKDAILFARDYLGLRPNATALIETGPDYYPEPGYIDDRIFTYYLRVDETKGHITPRRHSGPMDRFQAKGVLREMDAQQVLNAITVGMIPNARLELQILALFKHLNMKAENWTGRRLQFQAGAITGSKKLRTLLNIYGSEMKRFREIKGGAGQLRPIHSIFVEEGQTRGAITGLSSQDVDFVVHNDRTVNTAVILPLAQGLKNDIHAGFLFEHLPVPERREGNGLSLDAISLNLPAHVKDTKQAKKFIADHFGLLPELVLKLGESYFSHISMTPQRIHPFAVTLPGNFIGDPNIHFLPFYQLKLLRKSLSKSVHFMVLMARSYRLFNDDLKLEARMRVSQIVKERFAAHQPDWTMPLEYTRAPTLGDITPRSIAATEAALDEIERKEELEAEKSQEKVKDFQQKPVLAPAPEPEIAVGENKEFEAELEEFIGDLQEDQPKPRPEKW